MSIICSYIYVIILMQPFRSLYIMFAVYSYFSTMHNHISPVVVHTVVWFQQLVQWPLNNHSQWHQWWLERTVAPDSETHATQMVHHTIIVDDRHNN